MIRLTDEQKKLEQKVRPIIEWMNENLQPHTKITIEYDRYDLF